jgi:hypothetical protein
MIGDQAPAPRAGAGSTCGTRKPPGGQRALFGGRRALLGPPHRRIWTGASSDAAGGSCSRGLLEWFGRGRPIEPVGTGLAGPVAGAAVVAPGGAADHLGGELGR